LTSIIEKRQTVHRQLSEQKKLNEALEKEALQLEVLANLGSATAMIAHELNNLLTPLTNYAELALRHTDDRVLVERALRKTAKNCRHATKVMESILSVAKSQAGPKVETPLLPIINGAFDCLCRDFKKDSITVEVAVACDLLVWAVPEQLQQALMNLILNAREAMIPRWGKLTIDARQTADAVRIRISDTGRGISQHQMKRIFDSFFSTKNKKPSENGSGSGLGLALCKKVVDAHEGSITVESQPAKGTTFTILLPNKRGTNKSK